MYTTYYYYITATDGKSEPIQSSSGNVKTYCSGATLICNTESCQGQTWSKCSTCGGDGKVNTTTTCSTCGGNKTVTTTGNCSNCGGSGITNIICNICGKEGYVAYLCNSCNALSINGYGNKTPNTKCKSCGSTNITQRKIMYVSSS